MRCSSLYNVVNYQKNMLSKAVDNYQKIFGINVSVYRSKSADENPNVKAYGRSKIVNHNNNKRDFIGEFEILANPMTLYFAYTGGATNEIEIHTSTDKLMMGDVISYTWADGSNLEFQITELPQTYGDIYFTYKIKGLFSTKLGLHD